MLAVSSVPGGEISGSLTSDPATNFFLSLGHIQLVALSRWLPVNLPNKYNDYAKGLEWSIPYLNLPWEKAHVSPANEEVTKLNHSDIYQSEQPKEVNSRKAATLVQAPRHGPPPAWSLESTLMGEAENAKSNYLDSQESDGWRDFKRCMFWLAVIGGSLILLHGLVILIIEIRFPHTHKDYGALTFPRFEIFCIIVALPCICKASTSLIRVKGGDRLAVMVGTLLLCAVFLILLSFFLFLLVGVTLGMLLLYDEAYYEEGQEQGKLNQLIRVTLGPNLRGQWKWKDRTKEVYLRILGPLFEDLRGINSQNRDGGGGGDRINPYNEEIEVAEALGRNLRKNGDGIIASYDKTKDAGGNSKRNGDDIIASDDITEDARGPGEIPNENEDYMIISDNKTEDTRGAGGNAWYGDGNEEIEVAEALGGNLRKNGDGIIASYDKTKDAGGNSRRNGDDVIASDDITEDARGPGEIPNENDDYMIISDNKTQDTRGAGCNACYGDGIFREEAILTQKLLSIPRTYYTLLTTVRQVILGILAGAYISDDESSKSPEVITQTMNCFLLFFLIFLKPFISKSALVVEISSLFSEVALFTFILPLSVIEFSPGTKAIFDYCMVLLPFIAYVVGMLNQCYAFYKHMKHMDMPKQESFLRGLKKEFSRFLDFFLLREQTGSWEHEKGRSRETGPSAHRNKSSTTTEKTGMKQPREPIKSLPSSGKQASVAPNDPHQE